VSVDEQLVVSDPMLPSWEQVHQTACSLSLLLPLFRAGSPRDDRVEMDPWMDGEAGRGAESTAARIEAGWGFCEDPSGQPRTQ